MKEQEDVKNAASHVSDEGMSQYSRIENAVECPFEPIMDGRLYHSPEKPMVHVALDNDDEMKCDPPMHPKDVKNAASNVSDEGMSEDESEVQCPVEAMMDGNSDSPEKCMVHDCTSDNEMKCINLMVKLTHEMMSACGSLRGMYREKKLRDPLEKVNLSHRERYKRMVADPVKRKQMLDKKKPYQIERRAKKRLQKEQGDVNAAASNVRDEGMVLDIIDENAGECPVESMMDSNSDSLEEPMVHDCTEDEMKCDPPMHIDQPKDVKKAASNVGDEGMSEDESAVECPVEAMMDGRSDHSPEEPMVHDSDNEDEMKVNVGQPKESPSPVGNCVDDMKEDGIEKLDGKEALGISCDVEKTEKNDDDIYLKYASKEWWKRFVKDSFSRHYGNYNPRYRKIPKTVTKEETNEYWPVTSIEWMHRYVNDPEFTTYTVSDTPMYKKQEIDKVYHDVPDWVIEKVRPEMLRRRLEDKETMPKGSKYLQMRVTDNRNRYVEVWMRKQRENACKLSDDITKEDGIEKLDGKEVPGISSDGNTTEKTEKNDDDIYLKCCSDAWWTRNIFDPFTRFYGNNYVPRYRKIPKEVTKEETNEYWPVTSIEWMHRYVNDPDFPTHKVTDTPMYKKQEWDIVYPDHPDWVIEAGETKPSPGKVGGRTLFMR